MNLFYKKIVMLFYIIFYDIKKYARYIGVEIGDNCRIYTTQFGSEPFLISIGNNVTITSGVRFLTHDGSTWLFKDEKGRRFNYKRIKIGNNIFIGVNSIIMPGVIIDDDVIVASGSVVTKSIPKGSIVAGVPAKIIGDFYKLKENAITNFYSEKDVSNMKI